MSIISTVPKGAAVEGINPNLLRNWYFVGGGTGRGVFPVNSRGATSYTTAETLTIDGWRLEQWNTSTRQISVLSSGIRLYSETSSEHCSCLSRQKIENGINFAGKTITASVFVTGNVSGSNRLFIMGDGNTSRYGSKLLSLGLNSLTVTLSDSINGLSIAFGQHGSESGRGTTDLTVSAIKLELGSEQTLAHQENGVWVLNEIPDYEYELYRCKTSTADTADLYANKVLSTNLPNKNLLDNWYFVGGGSYFSEGAFPINQRGQAQYTNEGWCIDRWYLKGSGSTLAIGTNGITLTAGSSGILQLVHGLVRGRQGLLDGKTVTLSIKALSVSGTCKISIAKASSISSNISTIATTSFSSAGVYTVTTTIDRTSANRINYLIQAEANSVITVEAIKLELGTEQTLAHQENGAWVLNEIPDYGEELRKCQRYLQPVLLCGYDGGGLQNCMARWLSSSSQFQVMTWLRLSPQMRSAPTSLVNTLNASARVVIFDTRNGTVTTTPAVTSFGLNSGASPISAYIYAVTGSAQSAVDNGVYQYEIDAANASSGGLFISAES